MEPNKILAQANAALEVTGDLYAALKVLELNGYLDVAAAAGDPKAAEQARAAIAAFDALDFSEEDEIVEHQGAHPPIPYFPDIGDEVRWTSSIGEPVLVGTVTQLALNPEFDEPFFLAHDGDTMLWGRLCDITHVNDEAVG